MGSPGVDGWDAPLAARWEARGNSPGAEDRYRGSGGDQFERQSGRALALRGGGGGGGGRRTRRRTRQTELGAGWGLLETCHAGTGLAVRRGTSDRPLIGHPWHPMAPPIRGHGGPRLQVQGSDKAPNAQQRRATIQSCLKRTDLTCTMESCMSKSAPFQSPLFSNVSRDMPATSRYQHKMEGVRQRAVQQMPVSLGRTSSPPDWAESRLLTSSPNIQSRILRQAGRNYIMVPVLGRHKGQSAGIS